jgi:hypothetical protein
VTLQREDSQLTGHSNPLQISHLAPRLTTVGANSDRSDRGQSPHYGRTSKGSAGGAVSAGKKASARRARFTRHFSRSPRRMPSMASVPAYV